MKKSITLLIATTIIAIFIFSIGYFCGKRHVYSLNNTYYNKTEALLDSIYNWDESFMGTVMETDIYYEYELSCIEMNGYH